MKSGTKKYSREIAYLKSLFFKGGIEKTISIHSNRPDVCSVCLSPINKFDNGGRNFDNEGFWADHGIAICGCCGHVSMRGGSGMLKINGLLAKEAEESWKNWLNGK